VSKPEILWQGDNELAVATETGARRFSYVRRGNELLLTDGHGYWIVTSGGAGGPARDPQAGTEARPTSIDGRVMSQMPGKVLDVRVKQGDTVAQGDVLLVLEAMKMEHAMTAPLTGVVKHLTLKPGARVMPGELLAEIEPL
jgi:acetyl/propionyl-CoA carboxylase alpha subunit